MYNDVSSRADVTTGSSPFAGPPPTESARSAVKDPTGVNLMLLSRSGTMQTLYLPYPPRGRAVFPGGAPVYAEEREGRWHVSCLKNAMLSDQEGELPSGAPLVDHRVLFAADSGDDYILYAEEVNEDSYTFHNYIATPNAPISIGRVDDNDIVYPESMVSRHHALLLFDGKHWHMRDNGSANGVFVDGRRVSEKALAVGEVVCVIGLRLIVGSGFIAINDGNDRVRVSRDKLRRVGETSAVLGMMPAAQPREVELFNRLPRRRLAMEEKRIEIEPPPLPVNSEKMPMMMRMGSSMVMGGTAALTGNVTMLVSSILLPILSGRYTKEEQEEYERLRHERYGEYLEEKRGEIQAEKRHEEEVLRSNYPGLREVLTYATRRERLWERSKTDDDFLVLRIGSGDVPLKAEISYAKRRLEMDTDDLMEDMYDLAEAEVRLRDVPILQNLAENPVWGILGRRETALRLVNSMVMRLSLLYSYDEVKLVFLVDPQERGMEYISWLPHAWDDERRIRFVARSTADVYQIGEHIKASLGEDLDKLPKLNELVRKHPYYVVFALSKKLFDCMEVLKTAMQQDTTCGISVIAVFDDVPKECSLLLRCGEEGNTVNYLRQIDREDDTFTLDDWDDRAAAVAMRAIANTRLRLVTGNYILPKTLTFLEMLGAGRVEHLNIARRWRENNPVSSLAVPIGVGTDGETFMLDLHQKFQGPHGLVAGTTGSGKSEFLLTYILSLALNFHPNEVAFVLIDYKGGGLVGAFDDPANGIRLPHLAGAITNLDGPAIARSLVSIKSEMTRRQRVFNEAKSAVGEGTMDIYTYQRLFRAGAVSEPMPHLFIISDEFAELKQQQPEFLDQLVSIARIGRSLGVHLILATQKPAGVVTDQILSNTRFRVCLKVQDRNDSMDMLKRPEAANIRETGRFYLQVGNNELFVMGQSAWSGAEYEPQDEVLVKRDDSVQVIDSVGGSVLEVKPARRRNTTGKSQLVTIVRTLADMARDMGLSTRQLWVPALEKTLDIDDPRLAPDPAEAREPGCVRVNVGLLDDPQKQEQRPMPLELNRVNHLLVCGQQGTGKTTFVQSLLLTLARQYTPEEVNFYILDYSSRLLNVFARLPHCGAALGEEQEDQLSALFKLVDGIIQSRKKLFTALEVDSYESACQLRKLPLVLVVIDNLAGLRVSRAGESQYDRLQGYMKAAGSYGVRFLITVSHLNDAVSRIRQEMDGRIALHLKDKYDFSDALEKRVTYIPPDCPGRGLYFYDERPLEMHLAMYEPDKPDKERVQDLKKEIDALCARYSGYQRAPHLQVISETETYADFAARFGPLRFPLGYSLKNGEPVALPLKQFSMLSLYFGNPDSVKPVLDNFVLAGQREKMAVLFLKSRNGSVWDQLPHSAGANAIEGDAEGVTSLFQGVLYHIKKRHEMVGEYCAEHNLNPKKPDIHRDVFDYLHEKVQPVLVVLERFADLCAAEGQVENIVSAMSSIFLLARRSQVYVIAGFYPEDREGLSGSKLMGCFNPEQLVMLFGGALSQQRLVQLPYELSNIDRPTAHNRCVMYYRKAPHQLLMPCGVLERDTMDEDEKPIFGAEQD